MAASQRRRRLRNVHFQPKGCACSLEFHHHLEVQSVISNLKKVAPHGIRANKSDLQNIESDRGLAKHAKLIVTLPAISLLKFCPSTVHRYPLTPTEIKIPSKQLSALIGAEPFFLEVCLGCWSHFHTVSLQPGRLYIIYIYKLVLMACGHVALWWLLGWARAPIIRPSDRPRIKNYRNCPIMPMLMKNMSERTTGKRFGELFS